MAQFGHTIELQPQQIWVDRDSRQRRQIETDDLESSLRQRGLINPIIVELTEPELRPAKPMFRLVAGERRLTALVKLGLPIIAREVTDLSPLEHQLVELEENIKRQDLEWQEIARAIGRVHALHLATDEDWTMGETAESIGLSISAVSQYLRVNAELATPRIAEASTAREAYNIITRKEQRASGAALEDLVAPVPAAPRPLRQIEPGPLDLPEVAPQPLPPAPPKPIGPPSVAETILQASFLEWASSYTGPKFNFLHCDFPYGIDVFSGPQGKGSEPRAIRYHGRGEGNKANRDLTDVGYPDGEDVYFALLDAMLKNLNSILSLNAHLMFWYSEKHGDRTRQALASAGLKVLRHPLIWVKSDNAGIAPDSRRTPRHVYETAILASRGDRQLVRVKADAYVSPTDKKLHPSAKPEPMLKHFFEMLVDEHTTMLDPTCGSAASLRAAEGLGAKRVLGLEIDPQYVTPARSALAVSRTLRGASRIGL